MKSAVLLGGLAVLASLATPAAADRAAWNKVKDAFVKELPAVPAGWKATKVQARVIRSAFQKEIYAKRVYRPKNKAGADTQVSVIIGAAPDFAKKPWRLRAETDPAFAKKNRFEVKKIGGRTFLVRRKRENLNYITHVDGRITVLFAGKWIKPEQIEKFLGLVKYANLAKVK